ncbi:ferredoxin reductase family protein [Arthrobacter sp. MI7-26]|uniref:ferredoxin reductase family protein n=1 Tax=Arthrobacter sp. MI7-26 TaxID=2993653 RepID=UPI002248EA65|nr:ferredoxin reductase family protein [Arthrobacter sp. MI7-26]
METIVWLSVALVLALFLADSGLVEFKTLAGALTAVGIIAGLVGTDLMLIQLLLAARLPVIDRAFGHDRALLVHQRLGKPVFYLISLHVLLLWIGYALTARLNVFAEIWDMFSSLPDMKVAYLGYGLLAVVVVTSLVLVRRKLSYEAWHVVHFLAYAAVLAALPHQFSTGQLFADGTWARYYWLTLYSGVAAALLIYRFIFPVLRTLRHDLRVSSIVTEASGVYSIEMTGRSLADLKVRGGQFFIWRFWSRGLWWHAHPFSLSAAPGILRLKVTVRELGGGTAELNALPIGTRVSIEGPYGLFTDRARTTRRAVAVAAGIGITPIISLLEQGDFGPGEMTVIVRAPDEKGLYLYRELQKLCTRKSATLYVLLGRRPKRGHDSWLPAREASHRMSLSTIVPHVRDADVFVCGPRDWTDLVVEDARRAGVPRFRIHYERFSW